MSAGGAFCGIDPGKGGGLAEMRRSETAQFRTITFHDCPLYKDGDKERIDVAGTVDLLREVESVDGFIEMVTVENLHAMPKNGSVANFSSGYSLGIWVTALTALGIPYQLVSPVAWKRALMAGEAREKDASRVVAGRMFPEIRSELSRVKDHNRADALLIAEYGRRLVQG